VTTYRTGEVAAIIGVSEGRVRQLALALRLGKLITPRVRLFSARDVQRLESRIDGRTTRYKPKKPRS
jgi:hypothetical protein